MDLASLIGLIGAVGMILAAMVAGGGVAPFIDTQSILIVLEVRFSPLCIQIRCQSF